VHPPSRALWG